MVSTLAPKVGIFSDFTVILSAVLHGVIQFMPLLILSGKHGVIYFVIKKQTVEVFLLLF